MKSSDFYARIDATPRVKACFRLLKDGSPMWQYPNGHVHSKGDLFLYDRAGCMIPCSGKGMSLSPTASKFSFVGYVLVDPNNTILGDYPQQSVEHTHTEALPALTSGQVADLLKASDRDIDA